MKIIIGQSYSFHQMGMRNNQEDARFPDDDAPKAGHPFYLVCDGVGGRDMGEMASSTVCQAFAKALAKTDFREEFTTEQFSHALDQAYDALDATSRRLDDVQFSTTMTFVAFHAGGCMAAHIGDSRIYQIRPHVGIIYRSDDHSLVNQMVRSGMISPDEVENHPQGNVITRFMAPVEDDESRSRATVVNLKDVQGGDYFFLCTDGVLHCVDDDKLARIITKSDDTASAIKEIAALCEKSTDNNTATLIPVVDVVGAERAEVERVFTGQQETVRKPNSNATANEVESVKPHEKPKEEKKSGGLKGIFKKIFH